MSFKGLKKSTLCIIIALVAAMAIAFFLAKQPVNRLEVQGVRQPELAQTIYETVQPYTQSGFFGMSLQKIQKALKQEVWIREVSLHRQWPNQLTIQVKEHIPLARWGSGGIISRSGKWIEVERELPLVLSGPETAKMRLLTMYYQMQQQLSAVSLTIASVHLADRGAWTITLSNGIVLSLGREAVLKRLNRFIRAWALVFNESSRRIAYVDLRYSRGLSVGWKK